MDMDKAQNEHTVGEMPCHDTSDTNDNRHTDTQHQCECEGCFQFTNISDQMILTQTTVSSTQPIHHDNRIFSDPDTIYYPPKSIS